MSRPLLLFLVILGIYLFPGCYSHPQEIVGAWAEGAHHTKAFFIISANGKYRDSSDTYNENGTFLKTELKMEGYWAIKGGMLILHQVKPFEYNYSMKYTLKGDKLFLVGTNDSTCYLRK